MRQRPQADIPPEDILAKAALRLMLKDGPQAVTYENMSDAARLKPAVMRRLFDTCDDAIALIGGYISRQWQSKIQPRDTSLSFADALFDALMTRFEIMEKDREAIIAWFDYARKRPAAAFLLFKTLKPDMTQILNYAEPQRKHGETEVLALSFLYAFVFEMWRSDTGPDKAATMARLDRTIKKYVASLPFTYAK